MKRQPRQVEFGEQQLRSLGGRIRELREARRWSMRQMAKQAGVSVAAIQTIEAGNGNPSLLTVVSIAESLGEPVDRLVATSQAATFAANIRHAKLPDTSSDLDAPANRPRLGARLMVLPARRANKDVEMTEAGFFFLLDGKVRFDFEDGSKEELATGDALHVEPGLVAGCTNLLARRSRILFFTDRRDPADRLPELA